MGGGGRGFAYQCDQHRLEIKSAVFTVERESYLVIERQQVLNGLCGQLEAEWLFGGDVPVLESP